MAADACTRLRADLDALPPLAADAPSQARRDRVAAQDRAVRGLITRVRAVGVPALDADVPAEAWLGDWATLADARLAWAAAGATGPFTPPEARTATAARRSPSAWARSASRPAPSRPR